MKVEVEMTIDHSVVEPNLNALSMQSARILRMVAEMIDENPRFHLGAEFHLFDEMTEECVKVVVSES